MRETGTQSHLFVVFGETNRFYLSSVLGGAVGRHHILQESLQFKLPATQIHLFGIFLIQHCFVLLLTQDFIVSTNFVQEKKMDLEMMRTSAGIVINVYIQQRILWNSCWV